MNNHKIIRKPIVTEKTTQMMQEANQYVFEVDRRPIGDVPGVLAVRLDEVRITARCVEDRFDRPGSEVNTQPLCRHHQRFSGSRPSQAVDPAVAEA